MTRTILRAAVALLLSSPAFAAELELRYGALERIIADQLFSQDGRHYVRGDKTTRCKYAYLEAPRVAADNGRLKVTARFSGRTALDMLGRCVGLGDSFDLILTGSPVVRSGALAFNDVTIATPRNSYYIRKVREALTRSFSKDFKIEVRDQARRLLEQSPPPSTLSATPTAPAAPAPPKPVFQQELASFDLGGVRVQPDALVLVVEFRLVVK